MNDDNEVLIVRKSAERPWCLPGGTPEEGEELEEALRRELVEEADIEVSSIRRLGVQQVDWPGNANPREGERFYQARYVCRIVRLGEPTPDPDTGKIWERRFVPLATANELLGWGDIGAAVVAEAERVAS